MIAETAKWFFATFVINLIKFRGRDFLSCHVPRAALE